jgi:hypothetical protein
MAGGPGCVAMAVSKQGLSQSIAISIYGKIHEIMRT